MPKLNVLIAGSTGYIGIELIKILCKHKNVFIKYLCGNKSVGKKISSFDKKLKLKKLPKIVKFKKKISFKCRCSVYCSSKWGSTRHFKKFITSQCINRYCC